MITVALLISGSTGGLAQSPTSSPAPVTSRFFVSVPHEDADLWLEDAPIPVVGQPRIFDTPPLVPGRTYRYTVKVTWRPNSYTLLTRTARVEFEAGEQVVLDMTQPDPGDRAEIRYVPTPHEVVAAMIELAGVRAGDVVYEPGCGDGRVVIAAVEAGAARGVGIDIDPDRVEDALANVRAARLEGRVEIRLGDALEIDDLSQATVVFIYMGDEFNALLRPQLWQRLPVGARIVSHRFTMGDWLPDRTEQLTVNDETFFVHLWTITEAVKARAGVAAMAGAAQ